MKRIVIFTVLIIVSVVGLALAQNTPERFFAPIQQIGQLRPQGIQYEPLFDQFVMVDLQGRLLLVNAENYETRHVLYESGAYNAYRFSHDGRYLALAIDQRIELWDTQSGTLNVSYAPEGANLVNGPLYFSPDDQFVLLNTVVPAPQATRRSENDTDNIPWLWDLRAARREANSVLPNASDAYPFFNFRNGLMMGANRFLIAGIPRRLQVIDGQQRSLPVVADIESSRLEEDPIFVWQSLTDAFLYVDPQLGNIVQVDTAAGGTTYTLPLGQLLNYRNLSVIGGMGISNVSRIIGEPNSQRENPLLRVMLGEGYLSYNQYAPTTIMLVDILEPVTVSQDQMGLLIYSYNDTLGSGILEIIRPPDVQQMVLHPDGKHLLVRRSSGSQPLELYDMDSGLLVKSYFPVEADGSGEHVLAFNADGSAIITDFQRLDTVSGAVLLEDLRYTSGLGTVFFTADSQGVVTLNGSDWRLWDVMSGRLMKRTQVNLRGDLLAQSEDAQRFLTQFDDFNGTVMEIVDAETGERKSLTIPYDGGGIYQIIPRPDWQQFLVVYANGVAVYDFVRGRLLYLDNTNLPYAQDYGWLDDGTIYLRNYEGTSRYRYTDDSQYGLVYHASGIPQCLVDAFPAGWEGWVAIWEQLHYRLQDEQINWLTLRLCGALPESAENVIPALTPTAPFYYQAQATRIPFNVPGVPRCLTAAFRYEALDYAALWREMSAGLDEAGKANLETLLCEGLVSSIGSIDATATPNVNQIGGVTPTPLADVAASTGGGQGRQFVMTIDVETEARFVGSYLPPTLQQEVLPDMNLILPLFYNERNFYPNQPVLSPDGTLLATTDNNGFVVIYRMAKSYERLAAEEAAALATRQAGEPPSIGLVPTATAPLAPAASLQPTMTPMITQTPPPAQTTPAAQAIRDTVEEFCSAERLYSSTDPAAGYGATGRLIVPPVERFAANWVVEPENGHLYPDERLPKCLLNGGCTFSFDQEWMFYQDARGIVVTDVGGQREVVLFPAAQQAVWPANIYWTGLHTLTIAYDGYPPQAYLEAIIEAEGELPNKYRSPVRLLRTYDTVSGVMSEPTEPRTINAINSIPISGISAQPVSGDLLLVSTPIDQTGSEYKFYIYDLNSGEADYFARGYEGIITAYWHPMGTALYYQLPTNYADRRWYVYDVASREHRLLGNMLPQGIWSRDGRYVAAWYRPESEEARERLLSGKRLPKLSIWDSETGIMRRYCIPEAGIRSFEGSQLLWSPDNRYVAFRVMLSPDGDVFPTPYVRDLDAPTPTPTAVPLDVQYDYQFARTMVLDTVTGDVTVISLEAGEALVWIGEAEGEP